MLKDTLKHMFCCFGREKHEDNVSTYHTIPRKKLPDETQVIKQIQDQRTISDDLVKKVSCNSLFITKQISHNIVK